VGAAAIPLIRRSTGDPGVIAYAQDMSTEFWDERYAADGLVYGEHPNDFLVQMSGRFPRAGAALDIGAGEGRNALFLASRGLDVLAVDQSRVGMEKAERLARERGLKLRTRAVDLQDFDAAPASLDVVSSIFVHLPGPLRAAVHARVGAWLKPGGVFVLEAYAPEQLARDTGGPRDPARLASLETILSELGGMVVEHGASLVRVVSEGQFHTGEAAVVQVLARRK
jgi:2-polyprenyl-3-methyl-5-hydroxy-6-metoxy-1,4-benzoquinol methylase